MSGMYEIWGKEGGQWWAWAWLTAEQQYGGPFDSEDAARAWVEEQREDDHEDLP